MREKSYLVEVEAVEAVGVVGVKVADVDDVELNKKRNLQHSIGCFDNLFAKIVAQSRH